MANLKRLIISGSHRRFVDSNNLVEAMNLQKEYNPPSIGYKLVVIEARGEIITLQTHAMSYANWQALGVLKDNGCHVLDKFPTQDSCQEFIPIITRPLANVLYDHTPLNRLDQLLLTILRLFPDLIWTDPKRQRNSIFRVFLIQSQILYNSGADDMTWLFGEPWARAREKYTTEELLGSSSDRPIAGEIVKNGDAVMLKSRLKVSPLFLKLYCVIIIDNTLLAIVPPCLP